MAADPPAPADAIVILGAPLTSDGDLGPLARERVQAGIALWRAGRAPLLCFVGGHVPPGREHLPAEADGAAAWARRAGVPEAALRVDRRSRDTRGNAREAARLLGPGRGVVLVTQPFHLRRACRLFREAGLAPQAHRITNGLQESSPPLRVLRWVTREYASWALLLLRTAAGRRGEP